MASESGSTQGTVHGLAALWRHPARTLARMAREATARLRARLLLVVLAALALAVFVAFAGLAWQAGLAGFAAFAAGAALTPRTGLTDAESRSRPRAGELDAMPETVLDILQALPDPAILLTGSGHVLAFNAGAREHAAGLRRGGHLSSAIRNPRLLDAVASASRGAGPQNVIYTERVPVERRIAATVAGLASAGRGGREGPAILVSLHDLAEQERLDQMRADFVANASHELRTPLASLQGFIETLQGAARDDPETQQRFLAIMATQAQRMTRLIDDLLSLSRVEMNVHLQPTGRVDVCETVAYVAETLAPMARESGIALAAERPEAAFHVRGERDELVQLFQNLAQNAIKYGRDNGHVWIRVERRVDRQQERPRIAVSVVDDGPGIARDHLPRLTERFYRVDVATSREKGGTGLGLAIVKHIVTRHRGELHIESEVGTGSTFTVLLDEARESDSVVRGGEETQAAGVS